MKSGRLRLSGIVLVVLTTMLGLAGPATAGGPLPYTDFSAKGSVGLCDRAGKPVTSGKISDKPFVWRAVSGMKAPAGYDGDGRKATLVIYQPRPNTYPNQWNGDVLTSSSLYSNPAFPMAAATARDFSLRDFMGEYRPLVDGLYQLRMYFGIPGQPTYTETYPATDIRVTGTTWRVVRGASLSCGNGTAMDSEQTPPPSAGAAPVTASTRPDGSTPSSSAVGGTGSELPSSTSQPGEAEPGTNVAGGAGNAPDAAATSPSSTGLPLAMLGVIVLGSVIAAIGWSLFRRSRTQTGAHS